MVSSFIPDPLFKQIRESVPMVCIDFVCVQNGKVLLTYRTEEPKKGQWWIQGGRLQKNETLAQGLQRLAQREIGTTVKIVRQIGAYEFFSDAASIPSGIHDVAVCYLVSPETTSIKLDSTQSQHRWIEIIEETLDPYVKKVLDDAGIWSEDTL
ncbi:MAG: NUDIX domain-containing protein [Nanoarchaeota archaeon]